MPFLAFSMLFLTFPLLSLDCPCDFLAFRCFSLLSFAFLAFLLCLLLLPYKVDDIENDYDSDNDDDDNYDDDSEDNATQGLFSMFPRQYTVNSSMQPSKRKAVKTAPCNQHR